MSKQTEELPGVVAVYGRFWREWLAPYRARFLVLLGLMSIIALASAGYAQIMQWIMEAFEALDPSVVWWGPLTVVFLAGSKAVSQYIQQNYQNKILVSVQTEMQNRMFSQLLEMDLSSLSNESPAALAARFSSDIDLAKTATTAVISSLTAVLTIIAAIGYMLSVDPLMTVILISVFLLAFGPVGVIGARIRKISKNTQKQIARMVESCLLYTSDAADD